MQNWLLMKKKLFLYHKMLLSNFYVFHSNFFQVWSKRIVTSGHRCPHWTQVNSAAAPIYPPTPRLPHQPPSPTSTTTCTRTRLPPHSSAISRRTTTISRRRLLTAETTAVFPRHTAPIIPPQMPIPSLRRYPPF